MKFKRWIRKSFTFTFAQGAAGAALVQSASIAIEGELLWIHQINSDNAGSRTAQLTIEDEENIGIFDGTAKAANAGYNHEFGVTIRRILSGANTLKCTLSGDPGAGGATIKAVVYCFGVQ